MASRDPRQLWVDDIDPNLVVKTGVRAAFVMRHSTSVARVGQDGFQLLPDGQVLRLDVTNAIHRQRMRELIAERLGLPTPPVLAASETFRASPTKPEPKPKPVPVQDPARRRAPSPAEIADALALLAAHGIKAGTYDAAVLTNLGEVPFTNDTSSTTAAVQRWLDTLAVQSQEPVRKLVGQRLDSFDEVVLRTKKRGASGAP